MLKKLLLGSAVLLSVSSPAWSATVVVDFTVHETGAILPGGSQLARMSATDVAGGVEIVFQNTYNVSGSFDTQLLLGYAQPGTCGPGGTASTNCNSSGITAVTGLSDSTATGNVATDGFLNNGEITNASHTFDLEVQWSNSNKNQGAARLEYGETSTFTLLGASTADMFTNSGRLPYGMIHIQGLPSTIEGEDGVPYDPAQYTTSAKYSGVLCISNCGFLEIPPPPVPLPGALLLLLSGLGVLSLRAWRSGSVT